MSLDSCIVIFGIRLAGLSEQQYGSLNDGSDDRLERAKARYLDHFGTSLGEPKGTYSLFIGRKIAMVGFETEDGHERSSEAASFRALMEATKEKLAAAGFHESPQLFIKFLPAGRDSE